MALLSDSWTLDFIGFFIGVVTFLILFAKRKYSYWDRKGVRLFSGFNYLFGHFKPVFTQKESTGDLITRLYKTTDQPFAGIYGLMHPMLVIRDPELIQTILIKDFSNFTDRGLHVDESYDPLSGHLFALPGQKWKKLRAKLTPAFTSGKLKGMFPTLIDCGTNLQNYLEKVAEKGELLDVRETTASHTINVIASVAFGFDVDTISEPTHEFRVYGRKIFESSYKHLIRDLITLIQPQLLSYLRIKSVDSDVEHFIKSIVKQTLEHREKNNVTRKDFFQLLVQLRNSGTVQLDDQWETIIQSDEGQKKMTIDEIAAQTFVFFAAGYETSSTTVTYCLYELAKRPELQQRVHNEIDSVLTRYNGKITYDSVSEMKYLDKCIKGWRGLMLIFCLYSSNCFSFLLETLRKYPVLSVLTRGCGKEYQIPETNITIEKGVEVFIPVLGLHRDEKYYTEPLKFNPDRFNDDNLIGSNQVTRPYYPFGDGPRNCIGMRLGQMQTKVGLILMLQKNRYELHDGQSKHDELKFDPSQFLLSPLGGLSLRIFKR